MQKMQAISLPLHPQISVWCNGHARNPGNGRVKYRENRKWEGRTLVPFPAFESEEEDEEVKLVHIQF